MALTATALNNTLLMPMAPTVLLLKFSNMFRIKDLQDKNELINAEANIRGVSVPLNFDEFKNMG